MNRQQGFTLIELLVAIAVLVVLLAIAIPSFTDLLRNSKVTSLTNEIVGALQMARSEALRRNATVVLCRADTTQANCDGGFGGTGSYANGWIVHDKATPTNVLRRTAAPVTVGSTDTVTGPNVIEFNARGNADEGIPGADIVIVVQLQGCKSNERREIRVLPSGSIVTQRVSCI
ncbi:MAG: GspH/FimT family pseudopilin [Halothiobacillaceae bacterium]|nr:GspH/FimT family pseudopilin [Halothiobacillaceae bacterium]